MVSIAAEGFIGSIGSYRITNFQTLQSTFSLFYGYNNKFNLMLMFLNSILFHLTESFEVNWSMT